MLTLDQIEERLHGAMAEPYGTAWRYEVIMRLIREARARSTPVQPDEERGREP